jgi:hypothetical protein
LPGTFQWSCKTAGLAGAACLGLAVGGAGAEEGGTTATAEAPPVSLDKLLTVPRNVELSAPRHGGATRGEWQARFAEARAERDRAQAALDSAHEELSKIAADTQQWQMQAPGLGGQSSGGDTGPLNYRLRQEIRRQRDEIEQAEKRLQELRVEARLAGVPDDWIEAEEPASRSGGDPAPGPR